jgi:protein phosphatase
MRHAPVSVSIETMADRARPMDSQAMRAFEVRGLSHRGLVRVNNEDSWFADDNLGVALVADGVGGHANGARASQSAVSSIADYLGRANTMLGRKKMLTRDMQARVIARAIGFANRRLIAANAAIPDARHQAGTTIVGLWAPGGANSPATIFHVGDSRMYLLRNGELQALTRDHSAYQQWSDSGKHEAAPPKSYILQALGLSDVSPDIVITQASPGDIFLLCTDGLTNSIADAELRNALAAGLSLDAMCEQLVSLGLARGGTDNLTTVLCAFSRSEGAQ